MSRVLTSHTHVERTGGESSSPDGSDGELDADDELQAALSALELVRTPSTNKHRAADGDIGEAGALIRFLSKAAAGQPAAGPASRSASRRRTLPPHVDDDGGASSDDGSRRRHGSSPEDSGDDAVTVGGPNEQQIVALLVKDAEQRASTTRASKKRQADFAAFVARRNRPPDAAAAKARQERLGRVRLRVAALTGATSFGASTSVSPSSLIRFGGGTSANVSPAAKQPPGGASSEFAAGSMTANGRSWPTLVSAASPGHTSLSIRTDFGDLSTTASPVASPKMAMTPAAQVGPAAATAAKDGLDVESDDDDLAELVPLHGAEEDDRQPRKARPESRINLVGFAAGAASNVISTGASNRMAGSLHTQVLLQQRMAEKRQLTTPTAGATRPSHRLPKFYEDRPRSTNSSRRSRDGNMQQPRAAVSSVPLRTSAPLRDASAAALSRSSGGNDESMAAGQRSKSHNTSLSASSASSSSVVRPHPTSKQRSQSRKGVAEQHAQPSNQSSLAAWCGHFSTRRAQWTPLPTTVVSPDQHTNYEPTSTTPAASTPPDGASSSTGRRRRRVSTTQALLSMHNRREATIMQLISDVEFAEATAIQRPASSSPSGGRAHRTASSSAATLRRSPSREPQQSPDNNAESSSSPSKQRLAAALRNSQPTIAADAGAAQPFGPTSRPASRPGTSSSSGGGRGARVGSRPSSSPSPYAAPVFASGSSTRAGKPSVGSGRETDPNVERAGDPSFSSGAYGTSTKPPRPVSRGS